MNACRYLRTEGKMAAVTDGWRCNISDDSMSATVFVTAPKEGESITVEDIAHYLRANGVMSGLIYSEIEKIINEKITSRM
jgi:Protein of unknown function (DUF342).